MSSWFFEGLPPSDTFEALAAAEDGAYVVHSGAPAEGATYTLNAVYGQHITATPIYIEPDGLRLGEAPETHVSTSLDVPFHQIMALVAVVSLIDPSSCLILTDEVQLHFGSCALLCQTMEIW